MATQWQPSPRLKPRAVTRKFGPMLIVCEVPDILSQIVCYSHPISEFCVIAGWQRTHSSRQMLLPSKTAESPPNDLLCWIIARETERFLQEQPAVKPCWADPLICHQIQGMCWTKVKERKYLKVIKTFERINRLIGRFLNGIFSNVVTELQHLSKTKMYNPCFKNN